VEGVLAQEEFIEPIGWMPESDFDPCNSNDEFNYSLSLEQSLCEEFPNFVPSPGCTIANGTVTNYGLNELIQNKNFLINGSWAINASNSLIFQNCNFKMASSALITLNCNNTVTMTYDGCNFFSCDQVWRGIVVKHNLSQIGFTGNFFDFTNCRIEDAVSALYFRNPSIAVTYRIFGSTFNNNYVGLRAFRDATWGGTQWMSLQFYGNNVGTDRNLRPFYGTNPAPIGWPLAYAGVQLTKLIALVGQPSSINTFHKMHNGIVSENAVLTIIHNDFTTLWTNGILGSSSNLTINQGNQFIGELTVPAGGNAPIMQNGIFATSCDLDINLNEFERRIRHGIYASENQHGEFIRISQNSFSEAENTLLSSNTPEHIGIYIERSAAAPSPGIPSHNEINLNDFEITTGNYSAIVVDGANTATDELTISRNFPITLENLPSGFFGSFVKGIYIRTMNGENTSIGLNQVSIDGYYQSGNFGILTFTSNAVNISLIGNTVNGVEIASPPDPDYSKTIHAAIYLRNANDANAYLCNNSVDHSFHGLHFARGMATVKESKIWNHTYGVWIEPYNLLPMLGLQYGRGNQWLGNYIQYAAKRDGGQFPEKCRFWVPESDVLPFLPPSSLVDPNPDLESDPDEKWFRFKPDLSLDYCPQAFIAENLNELEMEIAQGLLTDLPAAKIWDVKRNLYRKLLENPGLITRYSVLTNFKNANTGSLLESYANVDKAIRSATSFTLPEQESRDNIILILRHKVDQIKTILSSVNYDITTATSTQLQDLESIVSLVSTTFANITALDQSRNSQISSQLDESDLLNEALQPTNVQEQNRKDLNRLIIKKLRTTPISESDYSLIQSIACQSEGTVGVAVQESVLLLSGCEQNEFMLNEVGGGERGNKIQSIQTDAESVNMEVSPNPSSGLFQIRLNDPISGNLRIVSAEGATIKHIELNTDQSEFSVNLSRFPVGVYFVVLQNTAGRVLQTLQIVVQ